MGVGAKREIDVEGWIKSLKSSDRLDLAASKLVAALEAILAEPLGEIIQIRPPDAMNLTVALHFFAESCGLQEAEIVPDGPALRKSLADLLERALHAQAMLRTEGSKVSDQLANAAVAGLLGSGSAHRTAIFPKGIPTDQYYVEFIQHLLVERAAGKSDNEIAREYTRETVDHFPKARKLLSRYRIDRFRGKVNG